jgi:hypothetical protein
LKSKEAKTVVEKEANAKKLKELEAKVESNQAEKTAEAVKAGTESLKKDADVNLAQAKTAKK